MTDPLQVKRMKDILLWHLKKGSLEEYLAGNELERQLDVITAAVPCHEQGSAATLRRLEEYLGDSLPINWEQLRFKTARWG